MKHSRSKTKGKKANNAISDLIDFINAGEKKYGTYTMLNAYTNVICDWALSCKNPEVRINEFVREVLVIFGEKMKLEKKEDL